MKTYCPKCPYSVDVKQSVHEARNKLQHHLYMYHRYGAIESHKLADEAARKAEKEIESQAARVAKSIH